MCGYFKFFSGGKFFAAAVLCVLLGMTATFAEANDITGIKASQTKDSTRIIIETEDAPKYSYSVSQDGTEYTVRIMNIGNPKKKYGMATITSGSILKSVKRGSGKQEVFYVFGLKKPVTPTFNSYRNSSGSGAKLVMEFPHNQTEADRKKLLPVKPAGATAVTRTDSNKSEGQNRKTNPQTVNRPKSENLNSLVATAPNAGKSAQKSDMEVLEDALFDTLNEASDNDDPSESVEKRLSNPEPPKPVHNARKNKNTCVVVIDPGHGGKDPGAIGKNGTYEKNVTLGISKYLLEYINGDKTLTGLWCPQSLDPLCTGSPWRASAPTPASSSLSSSSYPCPPSLCSLSPSPSSLSSNCLPPTPTPTPVTITPPPQLSHLVTWLFQPMPSIPVYLSLSYPGSPQKPCFFCPTLRISF